MIENLDTAVRLITVGASLLLLTLLIAGRVRTPVKIALGGLLLSAVAYLINSSTVIHPPTTMRPYVDLASIFTPFWTWLFGRRLFEVEPPRQALWIVAPALIASWFIAHFIDWTDPLGFYSIHIISLGLVVDLLRVALLDRADDLVEKRRLIRLWLPLLVAAQTGGVLLYETIVGPSAPVPQVQLTNAFLILALTLFAGLALLRTDDELLAESGAVASAGVATSRFSPSETVLKQKLDEIMEAGFYRTPGLGIAMLAEHLGTPEHRLRALINQRLGYRNFSAFLNRHRIAEARTILSDREHVDLPVLTIAMDLGYNSLATFNRAFRAETGTTPSDYRREALASVADQN
jgi:AraC-like DNA-binding protein